MDFKRFFLHVSWWFVCCSFFNNSDLCHRTIVIYATDSKMVVVDEHNPKAQKVLEPIEGDFIIGDKNAPVEVVFYGDFTCHHCMRFMKDNFFKLRDEYIFTKKVKFIFRPVITLKRSLYGAKFLFCDKRNDDLNADILWKMFDKKWMMSDDYINSLANLKLLTEQLT